MNRRDFFKGLAGIGAVVLVGRQAVKRDAFAELWAGRLERAEKMRGIAIRQNRNGWIEWDHRAASVAIEGRLHLIHDNVWENQREGRELLKKLMKGLT